MSGQFFDAFGFGGGEVILFGAVGLEVVEGPGFGLVVGDDFPVALAEGAVVFVEEPEGVVDGGGAGVEGGDEAAARDSGGSGEGGGGGAGDLHDGGEDVDDVSGGVAEGVFLGDASGPVSDEGGADAAFVDPGFVATERGVGGAGEAGAEAEIGGGGTHGSGGVMTVIADHDFGAGTIVREEHDEGVFEGLGGFEVGDDAADFLVHAVDHGGVDGHFGGLEALLFGGEFFPGERVIDFAGAEEGEVVREVVGRADFGFEGGEGGGLEAEFLLALMTLGAEFVPAVEVEVAVFGDVLGEGLEGEMRRGVSEVGEEGGGLVM